MSATLRHEFSDWMLRCRDTDSWTSQRVSFLHTVAGKDDMLRHPDDKPSIGLILCTAKNRIVAEYALRGGSPPSSNFFPDCTERPAAPPCRSWTLRFPSGRNHPSLDFPHTPTPIGRAEVSGRVFPSTRLRMVKRLPQDSEQRMDNSVQFSGTAGMCQYRIRRRRRGDPSVHRYPIPALPKLVSLG